MSKPTVSVSKIQLLSPLPSRHQKAPLTVFGAAGQLGTWRGGPGLSPFQGRCGSEGCASGPGAEPLAV